MRPGKQARRHFLALSVAALVAAGLLTTDAAAGSAWVARTQLSTGDADAQNVEVAVDPDGNATAVWTESRSDETRYVRAAHRPSGGTWGPPEIVATGPNMADARLAVDGLGGATAVWSEYDRETANYHVLTAYRQVNGQWTAPKSLTTDGRLAPPQIAGNDAGDVIAVWQAEVDDVTRVQVATGEAGNRWGRPVSVTNGQPAGTTRVAMDQDGNAIASWRQDDGIFAAYNSGGSRWTQPQRISQTGGKHHIAFDGHGNAIAVWPEGIVSKTPIDIRWAYLPKYGQWTTPGTAGSLFNASRHEQHVAVNGRGDAVIVTMDDANGVRAYRRPAGGSWNVTRVAEPRSAGALGDVAIDDEGHAIAVWTGGVAWVSAAHMSSDGSWTAPAGVSDPANPSPVRRTQVAANPGGEFVAAWETDSGPTTVHAAGLAKSAATTVMTKPSEAGTSVSIPAAWQATDWWSPVTGYDVRYRSASWTGGFGTPVTWQSGTTATSATLAGSAGRSYCFSARARDAAYGTGAWSPELCAATPLDDRKLAASSHWYRGTSSSYYLGTFTRSKSTGATLTRTGLHAKSLSLVATTCSNCGRVTVSFNGKTLRTVDLHSVYTSHRRQLPIGTFATPQTGTLKIVSQSSKPVYVDGVVVRAF